MSPTPSALRYLGHLYVRAVTEHPILKMVRDAIPQANRLGKAIWLEHGKPNGYPLWQIPAVLPHSTTAEGNGPNHRQVTFKLALDNYSHHENYAAPGGFQPGALKFVGTDDDKVWDTKQVRNQSMWTQLKTAEQMAKRMITYLFVPLAEDTDGGDED
jgi:hypothetical protein